VWLRKVRKRKRDERTHSAATRLRNGAGLRQAFRVGSTMKPMLERFSPGSPRISNEESACRREFGQGTAHRISFDARAFVGTNPENRRLTSG